MAISYDKMRALAAKLLAANGKPVTITRNTNGAYDPVTGGSNPAVSTVDGVGVLLKFSNKEIDGSTVLSSDRKLIYSGDELLVDDLYGSWRLVRVSPLDPDESGAIIYTCQLRK